MINVDTLAIVLRVLGRSEPTRSPAPVGGVPRAAPVKPLTVDRALSPPLHDEATTAAMLEPRIVPGTEDAAEQRGDDHPRAAIAQAGRPAAPPYRTSQTASTPAPAPASRIALSIAGSLLLDALKAPDEHGTPTVRPHTALLPSSPADPGTLARAIERAITRSGMFYESHVARWANDDFPVEELALEPQWHWTAPGGADAAPQPGAAPHVDAPLLLRHQLEANEAHRVMLEAQLWAGQPARIVFEEAGHTREHTSHGPHRAAATPWSARIEIELETLGPVSAVLALCEDRLDVRLIVGEHAKQRLQQATRDLEDALAGRGIDLARFVVDHG